MKAGLSREQYLKQLASLSAAINPKPSKKERDKYLEDIQRQRVCKRKGHDWEIYTVSTGYWSYDIEQAGYCKRCGYDTHGEYE